MKKFYEDLLLRQIQWIKDCGETLDGYIQKYCLQYNRSLREVAQIYQADIQELNRIKAKIR